MDNVETKVDNVKKNPPIKVPNKRIGARQQNPQEREHYGEFPS